MSTYLDCWVIGNLNSIVLKAFLNRAKAFPLIGIVVLNQEFIRLCAKYGELRPAIELNLSLLNLVKRKPSWAPTFDSHIVPTKLPSGSR